MNRVSVFLAIWVVSAGAGFAQKVNSLRDSLRVAADSLAYHPDRIDLRLKKASWNVQLEEWNYAKEEYDRVLSKDADNPTALYFRAYVNEKLSRYNFARLDYQHLLYIVPGNFEAQLGLALLNEKDKHFTEAFDGINRLIAQYPDSAVAYAARANMERERKMYEPAEYDYTEALKRVPNNQDYRLSRAYVRIQLRKKEAALSDLDYLVGLGVSKVALKEFYDKLKK